MSNRGKKDVSENILFVPLNKLKKSPKNVRKVPHTKADIKAFAASIAALGMLQYPVVEPELGPKGKPTGNYLVNAGEGRRLAQLLRVKRKGYGPKVMISVAGDALIAFLGNAFGNISVTAPMCKAKSLK